jgi:hypothetical protein
VRAVGAWTVRRPAHERVECLQSRHRHDGTARAPQLLVRGSEAVLSLNVFNNMVLKNDDAKVSVHILSGV